MDTPDSFWHGRTAFVTGCTGFLGTWVVRELLARGAAVVGLVRDTVPDSDLIRDKLFEPVRVTRGRVEDGGRLRQAFAIHGIDAVFHLAAPPDGYDPSGFVRGNWLRTVAAAAADAAPSAPLVTAFPESERRLAARAVAIANYRAVVAVLPTAFGPGDRRADRLVPRTAQAVACGEPVPFSSRLELAEPLAFAPDAASAMVNVAEAATFDPGLAAAPVDLTGMRTVPGFSVVAALTGRGPASVATTRTLDWYETRVPAVAVGRAA